MPNPDLVKTLDALLLKAKNAGAETADGIITYGRSLSVSVRGGALEDIDNSEGRDVGLRVIIGGGKPAFPAQMFQIIHLINSPSEPSLWPSLRPLTPIAAFQIRPLALRMRVNIISAMIMSQARKA